MIVDNKLYKCKPEELWLASTNDYIQMEERNCLSFEKSVLYSYKFKSLLIKYKEHNILTQLLSSFDYCNKNI